MHSHSFSIDSAIQFGWDKMRKNFGFFVAFILITGVIKALTDPNILTVSKDIDLSHSFWEQLKMMAFESGAESQGWGFTILSWITRALLSIATIKVALLIHDDKKVTWEDIRESFERFPSYVVGTLVYGLIVVLGLILFILPGIYLAIRLQYVPYLIIDKNMRPLDAISESYAITQGNTFNLAFLGVVIGVINIVGALCLLVGLFATVPTGLVAMAYAYRKLAGKHA